MKQGGEFASARRLRLSTGRPLTIEVADAREKIGAFLPRVDESMDGGLVTLEKVTVIRCTHHRDGRRRREADAGMALVPFLL